MTPRQRDTHTRNPSSRPRCQSRSSVRAQTMSVQRLMKILIKISPIGYILDTCFILTTILGGGLLQPSPILLLLPGTHILSAAGDLRMWGVSAPELYPMGWRGAPLPQAPLTSSPTVGFVSTCIFKLLSQPLSYTIIPLLPFHSSNMPPLPAHPWGTTGTCGGA